MKKPPVISASDMLATKILTVSTQYIYSLIEKAKASLDFTSVAELNDILKVIKEKKQKEVKVVPSGSILHLLFTESCCDCRDRMFNGQGNFAKKREVFWSNFVGHQETSFAIAYLGEESKKLFTEV